MSMPAQGGTPEVLAHFSGFEGLIGKGEVLLADGDSVYVSGYEDEEHPEARDLRDLGALRDRRSSASTTAS